VDRLSQLALGEELHRSENTGEKPLHVARATAVELAVTQLELERIARPGLALDRNAVAVAGEANAAFAGGPDGREQARLRPVLRRGQRRCDAVAVKMGFR
jgi:hypothetical protein